MKMPAKTESKQFGLLLALLLGIIGGYRRYYQLELGQEFLIAAVLIITLSFFWVRGMTLIYFPIKVVTMAIGTVNSVVLLSFIYLTIFTAYRVVFYLGGVDPLSRRKRPSYWHDRSDVVTDLNRQF